MHVVRVTWFVAVFEEVEMRLQEREGRGEGFREEVLV